MFLEFFRRFRFLFENNNIFLTEIFMRQDVLRLRNRIGQLLRTAPLESIELFKNWVQDSSLIAVSEKQYLSLVLEAVGIFNELDRAETAFYLLEISSQALLSANGQAAVRHALGVQYWRRGQLELARRNFQVAVVLSEASYPEALAVSLISLSSVCMEIASFAESRAAAMRAIDVLGVNSEHEELFIAARVLLETANKELSAVKVEWSGKVGRQRYNTVQSDERRFRQKIPSAPVLGSSAQFKVIDRSDGVEVKEVSGGLSIFLKDPELKQKFQIFIKDRQGPPEQQVYEFWQAIADHSEKKFPGICIRWDLFRSKQTASQRLLSYDGEVTVNPSRRALRPKSAFLKRPNRPMSSKGLKHRREDDV